MRQLRTHPVRTLGILLVVGLGLALISGIPSVKNATGWTFADAVGYVSWFGFLLCALLFLAGGVYTIVRALRSRRLA